MTTDIAVRPVSTQPETFGAGEAVRRPCATSRSWLAGGEQTFRSALMPVQAGRRPAKRRFVTP